MRISVLVLSMALVLNMFAPPLKHTLRLEKMVHVVYPGLALEEGQGFQPRAGVVTFLSREEGLRRLIVQAKNGRDEISMLYLPHQRAWITVTISSTWENTKIDTRYVTAFLSQNEEVEFWHTHNDVGAKTNSPEEPLRLRWTMPSETDLLQMYAFQHEQPEAHIRFFIASPKGVTSYWNDTLGWALPIYLRYALRSEAQKISDSVAKIKSSGLVVFAQGHQGDVRLQFTPTKE